MHSLLPSLDLVFERIWPAVVNHVWQATVAGAAVLTLLAIGRGFRARTRQRWAALGLAKFALPAFGFSPFLAWLAHDASPWSDPAELPSRLPLARWIAARVTREPAETGAPGMLALGAVLLGIGVLKWLSWLRRGRKGRRQLLGRSHPISNALAQRVVAAAERAGLRTVPRCVALEGDCGPGLLGVWRPIILLPVDLELELTPAEFEAILLHECIHCRRQDNLALAVQAAFRCLFWFNPVVGMLGRVFCSETEKSCDDQVLALDVNPRAYVNGIAKAVQQSLREVQPGFAGIGGAPLSARLRAIRSRRRGALPIWVRCAAWAVALGAVIFSGYAGALASSVASPRGGLFSAPTAAPIASPLPEPAAPAAGTWVSLVSGERESYELGELDVAPVPVRQGRPQYPARLEQWGITGQVDVDFYVDELGAVRDVRAIASTQREFEEPALAAVRSWFFRPGRKHGQPVITHVALPLRFSLAPEGELSPLVGFPAPRASRPALDAGAPVRF